MCISVLRITTQETEGTVRLLLEGKLSGPWVAELEACDQARFAPGGGTEGAAAMGAALERADELIGLVEKAALRDEGHA